MSIAEPIYVSEIAEKTMNPSFRRVDLSLCGPGVTRSDDVVVRVWTRRLRSEKSGGWRLLMETEVHMPSLQYLGKSVRSTLIPHVLLYIYLETDSPMI